MRALDRTALDNGAAEEAEAAIRRVIGDGRIERVLFVVPPDGNAASFGYATGRLGRYPNFPAYGVGILATALRRRSVEVEVLHLNNAVLKACKRSRSEEEFDFLGVVESELARSVEAFHPQLIGITCMFSQTHSSMIDVCTRLAALAPGVPIALGGVHVTNSLVDETTRETFIRDFPMVRFLFTYESDVTFPRFVDVVNGAGDARELGQLYINIPEEPLFLTTRYRPKDDDLDTIPAHDLITLPDLADNGKIGSFHALVPVGTRFSTILANRGCRARCTFCSVNNFNGVGVRGRSVQSVIDELLLLRDRHGVGHVMWLDDDFLFDAKWAMSFFNEMVRQDVGVTWDCTNGVIAYSCTDEIMSAAEAAGCVGIHIGVESGNPAILRQIKKPGTVEVFRRVAETLHKYEKINSRVFLMLGFPNETYAQVEDTFRLGLEMDLDWYMVTPLQPLPNTPIFGQMALEGTIGQVTFDEIKYQLGAHGRQRKSTEKRVNVFATDFRKVFRDADPAAIPTKAEINRLWAHMNYELNFARLFREERPLKHRQMLDYLGYVADIVAPDDAFAHYFRAFLYWKVNGRVNPVYAARLRSILAENSGWQERFDEFRLSADHLIDGSFPRGYDYTLQQAVA